jgi:hypothetical protein
MAEKCITWDIGRVGVARKVGEGVDGRVKPGHDE